MSKLLKLQVKVEVGLAEGLSVERKGLWVHCALAGTDGKSLGKAQVDKNGRATVKLQVPGEKPPALDVILSPLSGLTKLKRIRTEKITIMQWRAGNEIFEAKASLSVTPIFAASVDWLEEGFIVEGVLISRYADPQTEATVETPIRHAKVKLFDVDKAQFKPPWCIPDISVCNPVEQCLPTHCLPQFHCLPLNSCSPDLVCPPIVQCMPTTNPPCVPSLSPSCAPWFTGKITDTGIFEYAASARPGCCGSETPVVFKDIARRNTLPIMKPLSSPALQPAVTGLALNTAVTCLPLEIGVMGKTTYQKTVLGLESETDDSGGFWFSFKRKDFFEAPVGTTHTEDKDWDEYPDLLFEARLWIDGEFRCIYDEPYADTRWNAGNYQYAKLVVNGQVPGCDPADTDIDPGQTEAFLFHNVGDVEPGWIDGNGIIHGAPAATGLNDYVFGGGMEIFGQFKLTHIGKYYQVEYQRDGESDWNPLLGEQWYYSHYLGGGVWETKLKAPRSFTGYPACYEIPDYTDYTITRKTQLITWQSYRKDGNVPRYPNGLYHLRLRLLEKTGPASVQPVAGFNPNANVLHLCIDNNWPLSEIDPTMYVGELSGSTLNITGVPECGFVQRGNRYLLLHFMAEDLEVHFRNYSIAVNRGADQPIVIPTTALPAGVTTNPALPDFQISPPSYMFAAPGDNFHNAYAAMNLAVDPWLPGNQPLKQCAYNFTLTVWDRVTNGYNLIHWSQHTMTLTIME